MNALFLAVIAALLAAIGYFVKRILDNTGIIGVIGADVAEMKPKVSALWTDVSDMKLKINALWMDVADMRPKVDILWRDKHAPTRSPRKLNERGERILNESGIKEIIENHKQDLLDAVRALGPTNAYDAEQAIISVVNDLPQRCPEIIPRLKDGAFSMGEHMIALLFIGGMYLRDMIFSDLGFSLTDLDRPKNS